MPQECATNSMMLEAGHYVRMPNEIAVANALNAHDTDQRSIDAHPRERDAALEIALQRVGAHVWIVPSIVGNYSAIGDGSFIDDLENSYAVTSRAWPNGVCG
jgi:hypothetical protein